MLRSLIQFCACLLAMNKAHAGLISEEEIIKTLVVLDNWATIETHSVFFDHL